MTMPYITLSFHVKALKQFTIIFSKFYSHYSHIIWMCVNSVSEHFLKLLRIFIITHSKLFRIKTQWCSWKPMFWWHTSIFLKVSLSVFFNVDGELFDLLYIYEMEVYGVGVRCKIYDIKIVSISNKISAIGTTHTVHHWHSINKHGINISILIGNFKQSWKYFFPFFK